jgi:transposase
MIGLPAGTQVWLVCGVTDMRKGFDGLAALIQQQLAEDPFSGQLFVFRGRRGDRIKVLWSDADGLCLYAALTQVIAAKYADHCPLYRQEGIYRRAGVELPRSLLASWVREAAQLLDPLVGALERYVLSAAKLNADDTPVPVLSPGLGRTRTGRLWAYVRDDRPSGGRDPPAVVYRYSADRKGERVRAHLSAFSGVLQADPYGGFTQLYAGGTIREAACWAHARRKYYDVYVAERSPAAAEALQRLGQLYAVERSIRGHSPAARAHARREQAAPILTELRAWLRRTQAALSVKSPLAGAIQ